MADDALQAEVDRLRNEVEAYRQRELDSLRAQLATAEQASAHYRSEAQRLQQVGLEIEATWRERCSVLQAQLDAARSLHVTSRRPMVNDANA